MAFVGSLGLLLIAYKINEKRHQVIEKRLEKAIVERTLEVQSQTQAIESKNKELEQVFHYLHDTEALLLHSEKMVALGELVAGISHEMNTPLRTISTATEQISEGQQIFMKNFPLISKRLSFEEQGVFFELVRQARTQSKPLSSGEIRQKRKNLAAILTQNDIQENIQLTDLLVDMGIYVLSEEQITLLQKSDARIILDTAYRLAQQLQNSEHIKHAIQQISSIIRALKAYTQPVQATSKTEMDVLENIEMILNIYRNIFKHDIQIIRNFEPVPRIQAHPDELGQVWISLIHNALQAIQGKGTLEVHVFQEQNWVVVKITDSGTGIPIAIQKRIFEAFFTTKTMTEKTAGLGLSIVKKIIDKHQGKISFETQAGKTTFRIDLPIRTLRPQ